MSFSALNRLNHCEQRLPLRWVVSPGRQKPPALRQRSPSTQSDGVIHLPELPTVLLDEPWLEIGDAKFRSRLIVGIEQYDSVDVVKDILETTGADVFITTVDPDNRRS